MLIAAEKGPTSVEAQAAVYDKGVSDAVVDEKRNLSIPASVYHLMPDSADVPPYGIFERTALVRGGYRVRLRRTQPV